VATACACAYGGGQRRLRLCQATLDLDSLPVEQIALSLGAPDDGR
jgi:hypothetical protein